MFCQRNRIQRHLRSDEKIRISFDGSNSSAENFSFDRNLLSNWSFLNKIHRYYASKGITELFDWQVINVFSNLFAVKLFSCTLRSSALIWKVFSRAVILYILRRPVPASLWSPIYSYTKNYWNTRRKRLLFCRSFRSLRKRCCH